MYIFLLNAFPFKYWLYEQSTKSFVLLAIWWNLLIFKIARNYHHHFIDESFKLRTAILINVGQRSKVKSNIVFIKPSWICLHFNGNHGKANFQCKQVLFFWESNLIFNMPKSEKKSLKLTRIRLIELKEFRSSYLKAINTQIKKKAKLAQ